jgi:SAM-dependent methyltransferase
MTVKSPRFFEIPYIFEKLKPGNVLNIGGEEGGPWKWRVCENHQMTIVDVTPMSRTHPNLTSICADIRDVKVEDIGLFDNVLLMSTIEHISMPAHSPGKKASWEKSPREEQLEVFHQCMKFLKPGGHMIFTVDGGIPSEAPVFKLHYNQEMIEDVKRNYELVEETYYERPGLEWIKCDKLPGPDDNVFNQPLPPEGIGQHTREFETEEEYFQKTNRGVRALALLTLTVK